MRLRGVGIHITTRQWVLMVVLLDCPHGAVL
jgi:hypothetical protein